MKEYAPIKCPVCGEMYDWKYVGSDKQGFSAGKAAVGAVAIRAHQMPSLRRDV